MQPLPETAVALTALARGSGANGEEFVERFTAAADETGRIAPQCVGVTLTLLAEGVSFTWIASGPEAAALDAVQYIEGGPCVTAVAQEDIVVDSDEGPLDERRWQAFAEASAAAGVRSTLSIPLLDSAGRAYGGVNLYGATPRAFDGVHEQLAAHYGGWAAGAVTNADLPFTSMARSRHAADVLENAAVTSQAVGMIMAARGVDEPTARDLLSDASARAGLTETEVAHVLLDRRLG